MTRFFTAFLLGLFWTVPLFAQLEYYVEDGGLVRWQSNAVLVTGIGQSSEGVLTASERVKAINAARLDAQRQLLTTIKKLPLDSRTRVEEYLEDSTLKNKLQELVRNFEITDTRYLEGGTVEMDGFVYVQGPFLESLIPAQETNSQQVRYAATGRVKSSSYSGLIIDARGKDVKPALLPEITDEQGNAVYNSAFADRLYASQIGLVAYASSPREEHVKKRMSGETLYVKAQSSFGKNGCGIRISDSDAQKIRSATSAHNFFKTCSVVVLID